MQHTVQQLNIETLKNNLSSQTPQGILIDVREQHEWDAGHIPGAIHLPKGILLEHILALAPQKADPIYLQCKSGGRSQQAAQLLIEQGYSQVFNVVGGITAWQAANYPIE
jgi:sulfur-carrier protein adenylyltransferase/sulfurtransferase